MKTLKYTGLSPVNNIYGDWTHGTIKRVPDDAVLGAGFEVLEVPAPAQYAPTQRKVTRRRMRPELQDKLERDNQELRD
jgi:hypothetical protein